MPVAVNWYSFWNVNLVPGFPPLHREFLIIYIILIIRLSGDGSGNTLKLELKKSLARRK